MDTDDDQLKNVDRVAYHGSDLRSSASSAVPKDQRTTLERNAAADEDDVLGRWTRRVTPPGMERDVETYAIIGAAMEVHRELGPGFLEGVYHDAMHVEFGARGIPAIREHPSPVSYKGAVLGTPYRADFLCFGSVLVELKAIKALTPLEDAQVLHYLKATGLQRAVLINFGTQRLEYKRLVNGYRLASKDKPPLDGDQTRNDCP